MGWGLIASVTATVTVAVTAWITATAALTPPRRQVEREIESLTERAEHKVCACALAATSRPPAQPPSLLYAPVITPLP